MQEGTHHEGVGRGEEERGREEEHEHNLDEGHVQPRAPPMPPVVAHRQVHVGGGARGSDLTIGKLEWHNYSQAQGPAATG
jgi:hypothetical protein